MEAKKTIYVGNGKKINSQYGEFRNISICLSDLPQDNIFEYNGKKYIKLNINDKQQPDQYGKDVAVSIDQYKPQQQAAPAQAAPVAQEDDLPF
jgi:hypothetical protein